MPKKFASTEILPVGIVLVIMFGGNLIVFFDFYADIITKCPEKINSYHDIFSYKMKLYVIIHLQKKFCTIDCISDSRNRELKISSITRAITFR